MNAFRRIRLSRDSEGQTIHLPPEFELSSDDIVIQKSGDGLSIQPYKSKQALLDVLARLSPIDERLPEIERRPPEPFDL